ncbi:MAG: class I tRNA ligase family protein, partial [Elusimicrobiota bacterium]
MAFHPDLAYVLAEVSLAAGTRCLLLAEARLEDTLKALGAKGHRRIGSWTGRELVEGAAIACSTPFAHLPQARHKVSRGVLAGYVSAEDGTGVVHTAPGHGIDDFNTGRAAGLDIFCPVDGAGRFTAEAGPLEGLRIFEEGNPAVLEALRAQGRLAAEGSITHSYPHCWRCKNPIAFRATEQWFLSVGHAGLREKLLKAVDEVAWIPAAGKERIAAMVSSRPDWCISRQRLWGTPIPMVRCRDCSAPPEREAADALIAAVAAKVREEGSDFWFADPGKPVVRSTVSCAAGEVLAWDFLPEFRCPRCSGKVFLRETDILDVWVDSGASWLGVLGAEGVPCDLYLEGSDQHRGWFQSSLVLAVAAAGKAPYRAVLTHGFVLDDQGRAMHKSLGNVVSPRQVVDRLGADVLRLWTALSDYSDDVRLSEKLLEGPVDSYRKLRNTFRYLLGNIDDFDPVRDAVPLARLG